VAEYDDARKTLIEAGRAFEVIGDRHGLARCLRSLGELQRTTGEHAAAVTALTGALQEFGAIKDLRGVASCLRVLGELQHTMGEYRNASETLVKARRVFETIEDQLGVAMCLRSLGKLRRTTGEHAAAWKSFSEARKAYEAAWSLRSPGELQPGWSRMTLDPSTMPMGQIKGRGNQQLLEAPTPRDIFRAADSQSRAASWAGFGLSVERVRRTG
jgi:hypothetical protein